MKSNRGRRNDRQPEHAAGSAIGSADASARASTRSGAPQAGRGSVRGTIMTHHHAGVRPQSSASLGMADARP